jgi:hypothetical protein
MTSGDHGRRAMTQRNTYSRLCVCASYVRGSNSSVSVWTIGSGPRPQ